MGDGGRLSSCQFTFGVHQGPEVETEGMLLRDYNGLVLPPSSYYSYEPLPDIWEKILGREEMPNPQPSQSEVEAFGKLPTYKRESMAEGNQSLAGYSKMGISAPQLDYGDDQGTSYYKSQDPSISGEHSMATEEGKGRHKYGPDNRNNSNLRIKQQEGSRYTQSKRGVSNRQISECQEEQSEKDEKTARGTEVDEQETQIRTSSEYFGARERQEVADQMLFDELETYNPKLNREVSRILNEHN